MPWPKKKNKTKLFSFKVAVVKAREKAVLKKINSRGKNKTNKKKSTSVNFLNCPVVKTRGFHCRGHGFDPWLGKFCMPLAKTTATGTS